MVLKQNTDQTTGILPAGYSFGAKVPLSVSKLN